MHLRSNEKMPFPGGQQRKERKVPSSNSRKKTHKAIIQQYFGMIDTFLNIGTPSINATKGAIEHLQILKKFEIFMKETNYFIFDWSLEHKHLDLLTHLLSNVRDEHHLLMMSHDDYEPIKKFIIDTLKMPYSEYQKTNEVTQAVLERLLSVLNIDLIMKLSNEIINNGTEYDKNTVHAFQSGLNSMSTPKESQLNSTTQFFKPASPKQKEEKTNKPSVKFHL